MTRPSARAWRVSACAKINVTLRVLGVRADGYHELRTTFQSLALHDTLTVEHARGPFAITSNDPRCPTDASNLVWMAAASLWHASGRRGPLANVRMHLRKCIPMEAGLGGGSSDAAATLLALRAMWRTRTPDAELSDIGRALGADVPYFLEGGTVLGLERGDLLFPLIDAPPAWVVIAQPDFGVSTKDAYGWWDQAHASTSRSGGNGVGGQGETSRSAYESDAGRVLPRRSAHFSEARRRANDLQAPVCARRPRISTLVNALERSGARLAAMSGSGSAVFGLFDTRSAAVAGAARVASGRVATWVTRTTTREQHARTSTPEPVR